MDRPALIIVSGEAGTGKTAIGQHLATELQVPYLGKDFTKKSLFDSLGIADRSWSMKLGFATIELLFKLVDSHLRLGQSVIAESNFRVDLDVPRFELMREKHSFTTIEVRCKTDWDILYPRLIERGSSPERHPGHSDAEHAEGLEEALRDGVYGPLALEGELIEVDTTDFKKVDYEATISAVRRAAGLP